MSKKQVLRKKAPPKRAKPASRGAVWPVQEARANLSALIDAALSGKPQRITRNGREAVVVVREADFAKPKPPQDMKSFLAIFQNSPLTELLEEGAIDIDALRPKDPLPKPVRFGDDR